MGKKTIHGGSQEPRTGLKLQGSKGLSPYGGFSLLATLLVREPGIHTLGQKEENSSCCGHSWADGEIGCPGTHSFTSTNNLASDIPICEMGTMRLTWVSEQGHGKGFVKGEVL